MRKSNAFQILIGPSAEQPVFAIRQSEAWATFRKGSSVEMDSSAIGRVLAALQSVPDLLLAGSIAGKKLMEVEIHGDLVRASDGVGYRAFAVGDKGITEHARLFDVDSLSTLVNAAAIWRIASVVVAQKHLHDINLNLKEIKAAVHSLGQFQRDEQRSKIESSYEYLFQVEKSLMEGERSTAVRHRLEHIEAEMDVIQRHLKRIFDAKLRSSVPHDEMFGVEKITKGIASKVLDLDGVFDEHMLAGRTRLGALQMMALFPGESTLQYARAVSVGKSADESWQMCDAFAEVMAAEVDAIESKLESTFTLMDMSMSVSPVPKWIVKKLRDSLFQSLQGASPLNSVQGEGGSLSPRLDAMKDEFKKGLLRRATSGKDRAQRLSISCDRSKSLNGGTAVRYLVQWENGKPVQIKEVPINPAT